jgi:hypothetical protein
VVILLAFKRQCEPLLQLSWQLQDTGKPVIISPLGCYIYALKSRLDSASYCKKSQPLQYEEIHSMLDNLRFNSTQTPFRDFIKLMKISIKIKRQTS